MATYVVEITDVNAPDRIADDPNYRSRFETNIVLDGVVLDAGGGVAIYEDGYEDPDTGVLSAGVWAQIDATADPTTIAQAYSLELRPRRGGGHGEFSARHAGRGQRRHPGRDDQPDRHDRPLQVPGDPA